VFIRWIASMTLVGTATPAPNRSRAVKVGADAQQRGLPGAVLTGERDDLAGGHGEIHAVEHHERAEKGAFDSLAAAPGAGRWGMAATESEVPVAGVADGHVSIELRGASRRYRTPAGTVTALEAVDLTIERGEFVVVLGPSGSGKTTLLNLIGALDAATDGVVSIEGRPIAGRSKRELFRLRRETLSFIFQSFNLFPGLTALENVQFGADVSGRAGARDVAHRALAGVGLESRESHFPHQLSGGEQQRVAIARALATENPILLADEPTGELDYRTGVQILQLLRDEARSGRTVVVVTHNREISRMADRVVELAGGRVLSDGAPAGGPVDPLDLRW
jgi:putative ABC transport system ATP-binding protein